MAADVMTAETKKTLATRKARKFPLLIPHDDFPIFVRGDGLV